MKFFITLVLLITLGCDFSPDYQREIHQISSYKTQFQNGSLEKKENMLLLRVKGDHYQVGLQYGVLLKRHIEELYQKLDRLVDKKVSGQFLKKIAAYFKFSWKIRTLKNLTSKEYLKELQGIADGSGIALRRIEFIAFFPQIFFNLSCSSFVEKQDKQMIHGRNLDWEGIGQLHQHALIVEYEITDKIPYVNFSYTGYPGSYTGFNQFGLSISVNRNDLPSEKVADMPLPFKVRSLLENASRLEQVDQMLQKYKSHGWFVTAASRLDQSAAIYELAQGKMIKNKMTDSFIGVENLGISEEVRQQLSPIKLHNDFNYAREYKIKKLRQRLNSMPLLEKALRILCDISYYQYDHTPNYDSSINNPRTVQSMVMDNNLLVAYFAFGPSYAAFHTYFKYDLNSKKLDVYRPSLPTLNDPSFLEAQKDNPPALITHNRAYQRLKLIEQYQKQDKLDDALELARQYVAEYPLYHKAHYLQAEIQKMLKQYPQAVESHLNILQLPNLSPNDRYKSYLQLSDIFQLLEDKEKSQEYSQLAQQLGQLYYH